MAVEVHISILEGKLEDLANGRATSIEERKFTVKGASAEEIEKALKDAKIKLMPRG